MVLAKTALRLVVSILLVQLAIAPALIPQHAHAFDMGDLYNMNYEDPEGRQACQNYYENLPEAERRAEDPCAEARLKEMAAERELTAGTIYGVAALNCAASCIWPAWKGVCIGATIASIGADIAGALIVGEEGDQIKQMLQDNLASYAGSALGLYMLTGSTAAASTASTASNTGNTASKGSSKACWANAAILAVQSTVRFLAADSDFEEAYNARHEKLELIGQNPTITQVGGDSGDSQSGGGPSARANGPGMRTPAQAPRTPDGGTLAQNAIQSGDYAPILNDFSKMSGKSPEELFNRVLSGQPPMLAAAAMVEDKLGADGANAMVAVQKTADNLLKDKAFRDKVLALNRNAGQNISSFEVASKPKPAKEEGMPDLGALLGGLTGKKEEQKAQGAKGVKYGKLVRSEEGVHATPERSIFEIVGTRYQSVTPKFMAGDNVMSRAREPASSLLPPNPYLSK